MLALLLILSLFAGCGGNGTTPSGGSAAQAPAAKAPATAAPTQSPESGSEGGEETPAPADEGPCRLAAGKYAKDENGFPVDKYEYYPTPLCDNDEILTSRTVCCTPRYIPEGGREEAETWKPLREYTGVHVEYLLVDSANRSQNFSVLLASDDLPDMMDGAPSFYKQGTLKNAIRL